MATAFLKGRICFIFILLLTATGVIAAPSKKLESLFKLGFPRQTQKQGVLKKSAPRQDYSEKLDSIVYQYYDEEFIFDAYEKRKETFLYDSYGNLITRIKSEYNDGEWEDIEKKDYSYDSNGNLVSKMSYSLSGDEWEADVKYEYSYDSNNTLLFMTTTYWDYIEGEWEGVSIKYDYSYDAKGILISEIRSYMNNNQWENGGKTYYLYDSIGNLISEINSKYNDGEWEEEEKIDYSYDSNGKLISEIDSEYNDGEWEDVIKGDYSHDSKGNLVSLIWYRWNNEWLTSRKYEVEYDLSVSIESIAFAAASDFSFAGKLQLVNKPIYMKNGLESETFLYYSPFKTSSLTKNSVASRANASVSINKIQGNFMFTNHLNEPVELIVHALDGKRMSTSFIQPGTNFVDMTGYSVGVYLVSCRINGKQIQSFRIAR